MKTTQKKKRINSLYIHIPFCKSICPYCDFTKIIKNEKFEDGYISELLFDIEKIKSKYKTFKTVYIGGGTPSCLSYDNLKTLLESLKPFINDNTEFTIEANPIDLTDDKLKLMKENKINRISIGIQSFKKETLDMLDRNDHIDFFKLIPNVKRFIPNINLDFIYGLPHETLDDIKTNLEEFIKLDVNHISIYSLIIAPGTKFYNMKIKELDEEFSREAYLLIDKTLKKAGFIHYEVSNFAKKGYESHHNLNYWDDNEYIGIGIGASGYVNGIRYTNKSNLTKYNQGIRDYEKEEVTEEIKKEEYIMLHLRKFKGILLSDYKKVFGKDFYEEFKDILDPFISQNLFKKTKYRIYPTESGIVILDYLLVKIYEGL